MKKLASITVCLALAACGGTSDNETQTLWVAPYKVPCTGVDFQLCRLEKTTPDGEWALAYDAIRGFEAKWGHSYKILVDLEPTTNPPADGTSTERHLATILEEQEDAVGTVYDIPGVPQGVPALGRYEFGYTFYEERINCTTGDACSGLFASGSDNTYGSGEPVDLKLRYIGGDVPLPLEIVGWSYPAL